MNQPLNPKVPYLFIFNYTSSILFVYIPLPPLFGTLLYDSPKKESIVKESAS